MSEYGSPPPSYQKFIDLEDWYIANRGDASGVDLDKNLRERQVLLAQCLKEALNEDENYFVPKRILITLTSAFDDLILRGNAESYFKPFKRIGGRPKNHPHIDMAIAHAVKYIKHHQDSVAGFNRPNYLSDITKLYDVNAKTALSWSENKRYLNMPIMRFVWDSFDKGEAAITVMGEIYRNSDKAYSQAAVCKKALKRAGK